MKITPILHTRPLANGLFQIKIRICENRKSKYHNTGINIEKNKWDDRLRRVKELKSFPEHQEINEELERIIEEFKTQNSINNEIDEKKPKIFGTPEFLKFFDKQIRILESQEKYTTYRKYRVVYNHLTRFYNLNPNQLVINRDFLDDFKIYLFGIVKIKQNGFYAYFKVFRSFINKIIDSGNAQFKPEYNPFLNYKMNELPVHKTKLSLKQFNAIKDFDYKYNSGIGIARNMFVFSYFSGGMRIADLLTLQWRNIDDGRLKYTMRKTKKQISMPLNTQQIEILSCYLPDSLSLSESLPQISNTEILKWKQKVIASKIDSISLVKEKKESNPVNPIYEVFNKLKLLKPNEYIFPPMRGFKHNNVTELQKKILSKTAVINKFLKQISLDCEIGVEISTHIARHTFSDLIRQSGVGIYEISKILGHADIAVTQKYIESLDQESVDDSLNNFFGV